MKKIIETKKIPEINKNFVKSMYLNEGKNFI